jgi:hypothetical protein
VKTNCILCHLTIPESIAHVEFLVRAAQFVKGGKTTVTTNEITVARFHEGCYHASQPALNKFLQSLAGGDI